MTEKEFFTPFLWKMPMVVMLMRDSEPHLVRKSPRSSAYRTPSVLVVAPSLARMLFKWVLNELSAGPARPYRVMVDHVREDVGIDKDGHGLSPRHG